MLYVTSCASRLALKSIKSYLAGIQHHSIIAGYPIVICEMQQLYYLLRGIRRVQGNSHTRHARSPITINHLYQLRLFINQPGSILVYHDQLVYWAAVTMAFFGLMRSSEYTSSHVNSYNVHHTLLYSDISFAPDLSYTAVRIRSSKTDPFGTGCTIRIGSTGNQLCPVSAIYHMHRHHIQQTGPFFVFHNGTFLTRTRLAMLLTNCFHDTRINTHSFRIGGASTMASAGLSDSTIMSLGRWSSNAYQVYIRLSDQII